ncbi:MAG TPA: hypothetical protein PLI45_04400 [Candidatus Woesebacteria bacterium]|nr:hypothetical protein [Candidatus Woesebacteria bacterium]
MNTRQICHPYSLLATDNPASPAKAGYLDTRHEILNSSSKPCISCLRSVAQRTKVPIGSIHEGYVALVTVLIIGAVMVIVGMAVVMNSINTGQGVLSEIRKESSIGLVESCVEDALLRINKNNILGSSIVLPEGSCTVTINSQSGSDWDFTVSGVGDGYLKSIRVVASRTTKVTVISWKEI